MYEPVRSYLLSAENLWTKYRAAIVVALGLGLIYLLELLISGSVQSGSTYQLNTRLHDQYGYLIQFIAPFLHSNHGHILWNLVYFLGLSFLVLERQTPLEYLMVFLMAGWFTASIIPLSLGGGVGFGISGANAALAGWEGVYRFRVFVRSAIGLPETPWRIHLKDGLLFAIPISMAAVMIGQGVGIFEPSPGASVAGHFAGAIFGLAFGAFEPLRDRFQ